MNILFSEKAWDDYLYWQKIDKNKIKRINILIKSIQRNWAMDWEWKPEMLKFWLSWLFSRRIDQEHRLVYLIEWENLNIIACKFHY